MNTRINNGFTLTELSIVLVIVGLIIGGILAAQSMVSTSKILKVINQITQYDVAISNFTAKYNQLPGDSTLFGDNNWGWAFNNDKLTDASCYECGRAWRQLSQGTGVKNIYGSAYVNFDPFNTVASPVNQYSCPRLANIDQNPAATAPCLTISFPSYYNGEGYFTYNAGAPALVQTQGILSPTIMLSIDKKMDDGTASASGQVFASGTGCINGTTYLISDSYDCQWIRIKIGLTTGVNK